MTSSFPECFSGVRGLLRLVPWFVPWAKAQLAGEPTPKEVPLQRGNPRALEPSELLLGRIVCLVRELQLFSLPDV